MKFTVTAALAIAPLVSAHFGVDFPTWRADTLSANSSYDQWEYPCAGAPATPNNRTAVPLTGGLSLKLDLHHSWTYVFVNLGLGDNVTTNFNVTLTPSLTNTTGKGSLCIPNLPYPANFRPTEGQAGSLQIITADYKGAALYNCADVVFRANAQPFGGQQCVTTPSNLTISTVTASGSTTGVGSSNATTGGGGAGGASPSPSVKPAAGVVTNANLALLSSMVGLAVVFGLGSSL